MGAEGENMIIGMLLAGLLAQNPKVEIPLAKGLGSYSRKVATASPRAQKYFDQGLAYLYGFNLGASLRSFREAARLDPHCAMAYWGMAMACGPNINDPSVDPDRAKIAWEAIKNIHAPDMLVAPRDRPLLAALDARFVENQPDDRGPLDRAYADKMRDAWNANPKDTDAGALYAEALMDLRPWHLWNHDGTMAPDTDKVLAALEAVLRLNPNHPMGCHLYIHALEASPHPEKAIAAADRLRDMEPGLGHMVHMPSHIDVRTGRWQEAIVANRKAVAVDNAFLAKNPAPGFYLVYMAHNRHMLAYACMMRGRSQEAIKAVRDANGLVPKELLESMAPLMDGYVAMPNEVLVRFGKWEEILKLPSLGPKFPITEASRLAARGVAYAALLQPDKAREEQRLFREAVKAVPADAMVGNSPAATVLEIEEHLLDGEISYREGAIDAGIAELRKAVEAEDRLNYDEPPNWLIPTRHTLGAALVDAKRYAEGLEVYREDLRRLPNNGWSLYGMARALRGLGRTQEAVKFQQRFDKVWADADMTISSSCMCLPEKK